MKRMLLLSGSEKGIQSLEEALTATFPATVTVTHEAARARALLREREYELVVINAPLTDETGVELAQEITASYTAGVLLLVKADYYEAVADRVASDGVLTLSRPVALQEFLVAVRLCLAARARMLGIHRENLSLKNQIDELKMVDRAKCTLIQYLNMSEPQAHRYIEKEAMDRRVSRLTVALGILKAYET